MVLYIAFCQEHGVESFVPFWGELLIMRQIILMLYLSRPKRDEVYQHPSREGSSVIGANC